MDVQKLLEKTYLISNQIQLLDLETNIIKHQFQNHFRAFYFKNQQYF